MGKSTLDWVVYSLIILAALHLGLWGTFGFNLLGLLAGIPYAVKVVEIVIGIAGLYSLFTTFKK